MAASLAWRRAVLASVSLSFEGEGEREEERERLKSLRRILWRERVKFCIELGEWRGWLGEYEEREGGGVPFCVWEVEHNC